MNLGEINGNLKDIFNSTITSKKELVDPTSIITDSLSTIMIYALLRSIEINIHIKNNVNSFYFDKIKLQMIIIRIVFQSIETTSNGGKILISVKKTLLKKQPYLKVFIENEAYNTNIDIKNHLFLGFEHLSLENIRLLVEGEGGILKIEHNLIQGKHISLLFPYRPRIGNNHEAGKNNVYQLF